MISSTARPIRIGLLGMYASRNFGDIAIQAGVLSALRARRQDIEFVGLCQDPEDTVRTFGFPAFPSSGQGKLIFPPVEGQATPSQVPHERSQLEKFLRNSPLYWKIRPLIVESFLARIWAARRIRRQMKSLDMLLVSGSGQVDDYWGGAWAQPFRLMTWCRAAHADGKPVAVFGVGVDELRTRLGAWFCVRALNCAQLCVLRDAGSRDVIAKIGYEGRMDVCADPAFSLISSYHYKSERAAPPFAVISPIARRAWSGTEEASYDAYLSVLAAVADWFQSRSLQVRFVCSQISMDPEIVDRIRGRMTGDKAAAITVDAKTYQAYLAAVEGAEVVVGSRLHALILALVAGTPVVAISAVRKVHQLLADLDLTDHAFHIESLELAPLLARIERVIADPVQAREYVRTKTGELVPPLQAQFDRLAALIPAAQALHAGR